MGKTSEGENTMILVRPDWKREVSMKIWSRGVDFYMILITAPAREKGQVFMKRNNEMWNWVPTINKMIKIPPSMMSQSWMGSDFTNDDLLKQFSIVDDYNHSIIGSDSVEGFDCYKIKLQPKPEAAVVWGKIIMWISKKDYYELKAEYYDEFGELVNKQFGSEIKDFGDRKLPSKFVMIPTDNEGNQTILQTDKMNFNIDIPESFFSQQNMKKVR
ncbi:MAG: outer membrane lipoprotein-sorting protein [Ignavibacteriales bacterium]|nr:outer membrane lipoprotein-sorting protein [Ignavibacteriales bacterium]MBK7981346.1 outer membrane lipoprotein-sorting protein [Ignavibacteriota bacterium]